jgi:hypothetical protein
MIKDSPALVTSGMTPLYRKENAGSSFITLKKNGKSKTIDGFRTQATIAGSPTNGFITKQFINKTIKL